MTIEIILQLRSICTAKTHVPRQMEVAQGIRQLSFCRLRLAAVIQVSEGNTVAREKRPGGRKKRVVCVCVCFCVSVYVYICWWLCMFMFLYVYVCLCMIMYVDDYVCLCMFMLWSLHSYTKIVVLHSIPWYLVILDIGKINFGNLNWPCPLGFIWHLRKGATNPQRVVLEHWLIRLPNSWMMLISNILDSKTRYNPI